MKKPNKSKTDSEGKAPKITQQVPDGEFVNAPEDTSELFTISDVAKAFGIDEETFTDLLVEYGVLYREGDAMPLVPYPEWVEKGYFTMVADDATERGKGSDA
jgi:phage antirepressor YoqD-like protein